MANLAGKGVASPFGASPKKCIWGHHSGPRRTVHQLSYTDSCRTAVSRRRPQTPMQVRALTGAFT